MGIDLGVKQKLWTFLGNSPNGLDLSRLLFKNYNSAEDGKLDEVIGKEATRLPYPNWSVWSPNDEKWAYKSNDDGINLEAESGNIVVPGHAIYRIMHQDYRVSSILK